MIILTVLNITEGTSNNFLNIGIEEVYKLGYNTLLVSSCSTPYPLRQMIVTEIPPIRLGIERLQQVSAVRGAEYLPPQPERERLKQSVVRSRHHRARSYTLKKNRDDLHH